MLHVLRIEMHCRLVTNGTQQRKHYGPTITFLLGRESSSDRWIFFTKDQYCGKASMLWRYDIWNTPGHITYCTTHDDVIKWKHFPRYWPFVRWIHRSPVNSPHKGQWRGALMFSLICTWKKRWVNNREAGDFRRHRGHYDVNVMIVLGISVANVRDLA